MQACDRCHAEPMWKVRWRPKPGPKFEHTFEGKFLLLEQYSRLLCRCSTASAYQPIPGVEPPQMEWTVIPTKKPR